MKFKNLILFLFVACIAFPWSCLAQSNDAFGDLFASDNEFLPVEQAFRFDFEQQDGKLIVRFEIEDGYYLYQNQFKSVAKNAEVEQPVFPEALIKEDEFFDQPQPVFYQQVEIVYPIVYAQSDGIVKIQYQGCADAGLCYPPATKVVYLNEVLPATASQQPSGDDKMYTDVDGNSVSEQFELLAFLTGDTSLALKLLAFVVLGAGLAFTPCVFPMYPILSGIVIGQGKSASVSRSFSLSFIYVQGMAITYSLLGLAIASLGVQFSAMLQHPAILVTLIVIFVLLALVMFGAYELQLPSSWQEKLTGLSNKQKSGSYAGVFSMGAISGLVASPCTTAPLTAILLVIAQSGDLVFGFTALYALSIGMGIPLILFGVTGGKLLPKAGAWMNMVKVTFGFMMIAVALMFIERLVTDIWTEFAWSILGLATFTYFFVMNQNTQLTLFKGLRTFVIFIGLIGSALYGYQYFGVATDSERKVNIQQSAVDQHPEFIKVSSLADFETKLAQANEQGRSVMVDLYADWCVACKEFEKFTFPNPAVVDALQDTVWMQIDLTDNSPTNIEFQQAFDILGLPTIMFFDQNGKEISSARVTGFMRAEPFAKHVNTIFN